MGRFHLAEVVLMSALAAARAGAADFAFQLDGIPSGGFSVSDPVLLKGSVDAGSFEGHYGSAAFGYSRGNSRTDRLYVFLPDAPPEIFEIDQQLPHNNASISFQDGVPTGISYSEYHLVCDQLYGCYSTQTVSMSGNQFAFVAGNSGYLATITFQFVPAPVPEPATWPMLLTGLGIVGLVSRTRRQTRREHCEDAASRR